MHDVPDSVMNLFDRVRSAKNEQQDARALAILLAGEIFEDVIANQFLGSAVSASVSVTIVSAYRLTSSGLGANMRPPTRSSPVREMSRPTMPPVRDLRIEYGVTMA